jgi:hypothetical protein
VVICRHYPKSPFDIAIYTIRKQLQSYVIPATKPEQVLSYCTHCAHTGRALLLLTLQVRKQQQDLSSSTPVGSPKAERATPVKPPRKETPPHNRAMSFMDDKDNKDEEDVNMDEEDKEGDDARKDHERDDDKAGSVGTPLIHVHSFVRVRSLITLSHCSEATNIRGQSVRHPVLSAAAAQPLRGVEEPCRGSAQSHSPARSVPPRAGLSLVRAFAHHTCALPFAPCVRGLNARCDLL